MNPDVIPSSRPGMTDIVRAGGKSASLGERVSGADT